MASKHGKIAFIYRYRSVFAEFVKIEKATENLCYPFHGLIEAVTDKIKKLMKNSAEIHYFTISTLKNHQVDLSKELGNERRMSDSVIEEKPVLLHNLERQRLQLLRQMMH